MSRLAPTLCLYQEQIRRNVLTNDYRRFDYASGAEYCHSAAASHGWSRERLQGKLVRYFG